MVTKLHRWGCQPNEVYGVRQEWRSEGSLPALAEDILRHLTDHPDAADTVEGILQWWLPHVPAKVKTAEVQSALDALVKKGWLLEEILPKKEKKKEDPENKTQEREIISPKIYLLNETHMTEIQGFLSSSGEERN